MKITRLNFDDIKLSRNPMFSLNPNYEKQTEFALGTLPIFQKLTNELDKLTPTLENYARHNDVKIKFKYDPTSIDETEHKLNIIVSDNSILYGSIKQETSISPDTEAITVFKPDKYHSYEDNFARHLFRTIESLVKNINGERQKENFVIVQAMFENQYRNLIQL